MRSFVTAIESENKLKSLDEVRDFTGSTATQRRGYSAEYHLFL
jgi:hypothetical protein